MKNVNAKMKTLVAAVVLASGGIVQAAPLPAGSILGLDGGTGSDVNQPCVTGTCFAMEVAPSFVIWTNVEPGTDGGVVVGKNQTSGGQDLAESTTNTTPGELSAAWYFFSNYGTFFTPAGSTNVFDDASCAGTACIGTVALNSLDVAWYGFQVGMGSAKGCTSSACTPEEVAGDYIIDYTIAGTGNPWSMHYHNVVPDGDVSGFGNVKFQIIMSGVATIGTAVTPTPTPVPTPEPTPTPVGELTCVDKVLLTRTFYNGTDKVGDEKENSLNMTFTGHIEKFAKGGKQLKVCRNTTVSFEASSTIGIPRCTLNDAATNSAGTFKKGDKLKCTNKPDGEDDDRFEIKDSKIQ